MSLKDRKRSVDLYSLLGVQSVADVVRRGGLGIWSVGVWMIGYWPVERWRYVTGTICKGRKR